MHYLTFLFQTFFCPRLSQKRKICKNCARRKQVQFSISDKVLWHTFLLFLASPLFCLPVRHACQTLSRISNSARPFLVKWREKIAISETLSVLSVGCKMCKQAGATERTGVFFFFPLSGSKAFSNICAAAYSHWFTNTLPTEAHKYRPNTNRA